MVDFFKPEDFEEQFGSVEQARHNRELSAKIANAKLTKAIESWPVVYTHSKAEKPGYWGPIEQGQFDDTHKARIAFIEEIKKEKPNEVFVETGITLNGEKLFRKV